MTLSQLEPLHNITLYGKTVHKDFIQRDLDAIEELWPGSDNGTKDWTELL